MFSPLLDQLSQTGLVGVLFCSLYIQSVMISIRRQPRLQMCLCHFNIGSLSLCDTILFIRLLHRASPVYITFLIPLLVLASAATTTTFEVIHFEYAIKPIQVLGFPHGLC